jgi:hypothetical protein
MSWEQFWMISKDEVTYDETTDYLKISFTEDDKKKLENRYNWMLYPSIFIVAGSFTMFSVAWFIFLLALACIVGVFISPEIYVGITIDKKENLIKRRFWKKNITSIGFLTLQGITSLQVKTNSDDGSRGIEFRLIDGDTSLLPIPEKFDSEVDRMVNKISKFIGL